MASARIAQVVPFQIRVDAPTQLPSSLRRSNPNPQQPSPREWASTLSFKASFGGRLRLVLWRCFSGSIGLTGFLACWFDWYSWRFFKALCTISIGGKLFPLNSLSFLATHMLNRIVEMTCNSSGFVSCIIWSNQFVNCFICLFVVLIVKGEENQALFAQSQVKEYVYYGFHFRDTVGA
jgi:hypothetical protein